MDSYLGFLVLLLIVGWELLLEIKYTLNIRVGKMFIIFLVAGFFPALLQVHFRVFQRFIKFFLPLASLPLSPHRSAVLTSILSGLKEAACREHFS